MHFSRALMLSLVGASLVYAPPSTAQTVGGSLQGFITDSSGAALPNAQVLVLNVSTGATRELRTDQGGRYRVPILPPGDYEIHVTANGFRTLARRGIQLAVGQTLVVDLALEVGAVETTVSVTAEAPRINLANGGVSGLIDDRQIRD